MDYYVPSIEKFIREMINGSMKHIGIAVFTVCLMTVLMLKPRRKIRDRTLEVGLVLWLYLVFSANVLGRSITLGTHFILTPFWEIRAYFDGSYPLMGAEILENMLLFIPGGILIGLLHRYESISRRNYRAFTVSLLLLTAFSITIEILQGILMVGCCEFDDVFNNSVGGALGYLLAQFSYMKHKKYDMNRYNVSDEPKAPLIKGEHVSYGKA